MTALLVTAGSLLGIGGGAGAGAAAAGTATTLQNIGLGLSAGGSVLGGVGAIRAGQQAKAEADAAANVALAESQREAEQRRKEGALLASRQRALAAAQGASTDASILNIFADTEAETERAVQSALYGGQTQAAGLRTQGQRAAQQARITGGANIIGGLGSAAGQYASARERFGDVTPKRQQTGYRYG
jgi:hypothetical protein